jgi:hypothetical protein
VEISRRAYRDGDNEYLVNGQRVRLQDVVELLAQTGLGKRTYSVIGQGLIDRALSMAPEERRSLFEEAAGISGYQIKRATALRRLEVTAAEPDARARHHVAELSPRLGSLRRQAERARERGRSPATCTRCCASGTASAGTPRCATWNPTMPKNRLPKPPPLPARNCWGRVRRRSTNCASANPPCAINWPIFTAAAANSTARPKAWAANWP